MKSHKLLLLCAMLATLPWQATTAQTSQTTLVAQAAPPPSMPMPTADEKTAPANAIGKPVPGAQSEDQKKMPSTEETTKKPDRGAKDSNAPPKGEPDSRQKAPASGTHSGKSVPGGKAGAPDNAGMPGAGATSGSGGGADTR
ncbi:hypothetical protein C4E15_26620 [Achromobacter spanius]|uniref:Uncharacterized protein n=1 Tax=Achromobacter spanius TaxID=217203 RepID=A0A2S5GJQ1_9BURK|nr:MULTISPECIES: hypothetical protein [Achromobacter]MDX3983691.1 hypothetical protein [Achromobacter sp.]PPA73282.1 hypothetical protein C4E15_26620 [Achromobacter spanius]